MLIKFVIHNKYMHNYFANPIFYKELNAKKNLQGGAEVVSIASFIIFLELNNFACTFIKCY